ncbi:hypothetical protein [Bacteroides sp. 224]|uniref:hypothetical protein n=1 Tax=Bacteroides sp. 224 TaxID=2302936 RepID=UPI0013D3EAF4|nr:hypothetical protein [Bacteroides sp. 224]NDV67143.1 hypothetical protein [Bacteroides sp. 224]
MKHTCLYIITLFFFLIGLSACRGEESIGQPILSDDLGDGLFLSLYLPKAGTRAVSEDAVNDIYAFYFEPSGGNMVCTKYEKLTDKVLDSNSVPNYKLTNYPTGSNIDIIFIANLENNVDLTNIASWVGEKDTDLMKNKFLVTHTSAVWQPGSSNEYLPMYTRAQKLTIPTSLSPGVNYIVEKNSPTTTEGSATVYKLIRMVAKIEIENHLADLNGNLKLNISSTSVAVEKGNLSGFICNNTTVGTTERVTEPTLTIDGTSIGSVGSGSTSAGTMTTSSDGKMQTLVFYLFETGVVDATDVKSDDNCRIVFSATIGDDTTPSDFMLPIPKVDTSTLAADLTTPGGVLRNHYYKYVIKGVPDVQEIKIEFKVSVIDWTPANADVTII